MFTGTKVLINSTFSNINVVMHRNNNISAILPEIVRSNEDNHFESSVEVKGMVADTIISSSVTTLVSLFFIFATPGYVQLHLLQGQCQ